MNKTTKRILFIGSALLLLIVITVVVLYILNANKNSYGDGLEIANIDNYTEGKPTSKDSLDYIKHDLLRTINKNVTTPVEANSVQDILIRDGSFDQTYDTTTGVHTVSFIVDIKSLSQSYDASYQWADDGKKDKLTEWATTVKCLPVEKLIYGDFHCKDMFTELSTPADPILNYLPYSTTDFEVTYDSSATKALNVKIYTTAADERSDPDAAIEQYEAAAKKWIASTGVKVSEYKIHYTLIRASLY